MGHAELRMHLLPPLIHAAAAAIILGRWVGRREGGRGGLQSCQIPAVHIKAVCWFLAANMDGWETKQLCRGSLAALIHLTYFLPSSLPCVWSGIEGRGVKGPPGRKLQLHSTTAAYIHMLGAP